VRTIRRASSMVSASPIILPRLTRNMAQLVNGNQLVLGSFVIPLSRDEVANASRRFGHVSLSPRD
jgi:hypothetical protein